MALSTTSNTLRVTGDTGDVVDTAGLWTALTDTVINSVTYHRWQSGEAILQVRNGMDISGITTPTVNLNLSTLNGSNGF